MTDKIQHAPHSIGLVLIANYLARATSGEAVTRDPAIAGLTKLVQAPTKGAWLALLLAARVELHATPRAVPTLTDEAIPERIEGRIVHASISKSSTSGAPIAFIQVASASDPAVIYGPIMLFRTKDIRCAVVSNVVWTLDIRQPEAEARAARDGGLRASGTMPQND